jgi:hypothetical protein
MRCQPAEMLIQMFAEMLTDMLTVWACSAVQPSAVLSSHAP